MGGGGHTWSPSTYLLFTSSRLHPVLFIRAAGAGYAGAGWEQLSGSGRLRVNWLGGGCRLWPCQFGPSLQTGPVKRKISSRQTSTRTRLDLESANSSAVYGNRQPIHGRIFTKKTGHIIRNHIFFLSDLLGQNPHCRFYEFA